jgi:hypothetical protein
MIPKKSFSKLFFSPLQADKIQLEFVGQNNTQRKKNADGPGTQSWKEQALLKTDACLNNTDNQRKN